MYSTALEMHEQLRRSHELDCQLRWMQQSLYGRGWSSPGVSQRHVWRAELRLRLHELRHYLRGPPHILAVLRRLRHQLQHDHAVLHGSHVCGRAVPSGMVTLWKQLRRDPDECGQLRRMWSQLRRLAKLHFGQLRSQQLRVLGDGPVGVC
jgi:hypothetical protein